MGECVYNATVSRVIFYFRLMPWPAGSPPTTAVPLQLLMKILVSPPADLAMPVTQLQYIEGNGKQTDSSLLIAGGQVLDKPPILSLASLDTSFRVSQQTQ